MSAPTPRVLYCDDELGVQPEPAELLRLNGFEVDETLDGTACLRRLRAAKDTGPLYDALILDIMMRPGADIDADEAEAGYQTGLVVLRRIRDERLCDQMPVIVVTAHPGHAVKEEIIEQLGVPAKHYLDKPVPFERLLQWLQEALSRKGGTSSP